MICFVLAPIWRGFPLPRWRLDVGRLTHLLLLEVPSPRTTNRTVDQTSSMPPPRCQELLADDGSSNKCLTHSVVYYIWGTTGGRPETRLMSLRAERLTR